MRSQLRLRQWVGSYVIVEFVGQHEGTALYLAARDKIGELYWLLSSENSLADLTEQAPQRELFAVKGKTFAAIPLASISLAKLASFIHVFDLAFMGWRWAGLAEGLHHQFHLKHEAYQASSTFALDHFFFSTATQIVPAAATSAETLNFPAPEPRESLGPASDVYSLGAALLMLLGERAPDQTIARARPATGQLAERPAVWSVLRKASEPEPAKRYADGHAFGEALAKAVPPPKSIKIERAVVGRRPKRGGIFSAVDGVLLALGPAIIFIAVVIGLFLFLKNTTGLPFDLAATFANFDPFRNTGSAGSGPPARANSTARPLPQGALEFAAFDLDLVPPCTAHLNLKVTKGNQPVPSDAAVGFTLSANGKPVGSVTNAPGATSEYNRQLIFGAAALCPGGGTVSVQAQTGDSMQSMTLCASGVNAVEPPLNKQMSAAGVQVKTDRYPELKTFFSVVDAQNSAVHLPRVVRCSVMQDGQPISDFTFTPVDSAEDPVTVALVFDVSGSMQGQPIANARSAATAFVRELAANNLVCVYTFSTVINRVQACTTDRTAISMAIGKIAAGGNTALYDALVRVTNDQRKLGGRQVVIVLSDGADTASATKLADALGQLEQANMPVYAIALLSSDFNGAVLKQIAQKTGGSYLEAPSSADLGSLYPLIQGQLRTQYGIQFTTRFPERRNGTLLVRLETADTRIEFQYAFFVQRP